ncbi:hypothetical protein, partial [Streptomyces sp. NPDC004296]|uniref:hypothetical protein n=1 Tax=Streptomyces sp. NPDC004296 TaxID=3364697 RepID=UPI00369012DE
MSHRTALHHARKAAAAVVITVAAFGLTACQGGGTSAAPSSTSAGTQQSATAAAKTTQGSDKTTQGSADKAPSANHKKSGLRCTDQINYAGDPRSNADINTIGEKTGHCPTPEKAGAPANPPK